MRKGEKKVLNWVNVKYRRVLKAVDWNINLEMLCALACLRWCVCVNSWANKWPPLTCWQPCDDSVSIFWCGVCNTQSLAAQWRPRVILSHVFNFCYQRKPASSHSLALNFIVKQLLQSQVGAQSSWLYSSQNLKLIRQRVAEMKLCVTCFFPGLHIWVLKDFYINGAICCNDSYYLIVKAICSVGYDCNSGSGLLNCRDPFCLNRYSLPPWPAGPG